MWGKYKENGLSDPKRIEEQPMTRDEYNKKVQAMQEVWPESACRIETLHDADGTIHEARFQIYLDRWRTLGAQRRPFTPDAAYEWNHEEETRAMYHLAGNITSDSPHPDAAGQAGPLALIPTVPLRD